MSSSNLTLRCPFHLVYWNPDLSREISLIRSGSYCSIFAVITADLSVSLWLFSTACHRRTTGWGKELQTWARAVLRLIRKFRSCWAEMGWAGNVLICSTAAWGVGRSWEPWLGRNSGLSPARRDLCYLVPDTPGWAPETGEGKLHQGLLVLGWVSAGWGVGVLSSFLKTRKAKLGYLWSSQQNCVAIIWELLIHQWFFYVEDSCN